MSQGGDGIHHLSRGMKIADNLSMGVNQGNYYVLGGYGKFFLQRGVFLFTGIVHYAYWLFSLFSRHISRTQSFQQNRHVIFLALVTLKLLVSLMSRLVACSQRIVVDRQTNGHTERLL